MSVRRGSKTAAMRRFIVTELERACGVIDNLPGVWVEDKRVRFVRHAQYGCWPLRLATLSMRLDERWGTDAWNIKDEAR